MKSDDPKQWSERALELKLPRQTKALVQELFHFTAWDHHFPCPPSCINNLIHYFYLRIWYTTSSRRYTVRWPSPPGGLLSWAMSNCCTKYSVKQIASTLYCYCYWGLKVQGADQNTYSVYSKDCSSRNPDNPWTINAKRCSTSHNCIFELQIGLIWGFSFIQTN